MRNEVLADCRKDLFVSLAVGVFAGIFEVEECVEAFYQRRHRTPRALSG